MRDLGQSFIRDSSSQLLIIKYSNEPYMRNDPVSTPLTYS